MIYEEEVSGFIEEHLQISMDRDILDKRRDDNIEACEKKIRDIVENTTIFVDTRWQSRYSYHSALHLIPTSAAANKDMIAFFKAIAQVGVRSVCFGPDDKFTLSVSSYSGLDLSGPKEEFMQFALEKSMVVTNNDRNKEIKELKKTIEDSTIRLEDLRKEKREENKLKKEIAKKLKHDEASSDEWFDKG